MDVECCDTADTATREVEYKQRCMRAVARGWKALKRYYLDVKASKRKKRRLLGQLQLLHLLIFAAVAVFFIYSLLSLFRESAATSSYSIPLRFVSVMEARMDVHSGCSDVSCKQIEGAQQLPGYSGLYMSEVMEAATRLMRAYSMSCNCAPLYNVSYRYMTIEGDSGSAIHAFNPTVTGSSVSHGRVLVRQTQELLVPGGGTRQIARLNGIMLSYLDEFCVPQSDRLFTAETAWCIQSCIDLFNGKTIYDITEAAH